MAFDVAIKIAATGADTAAAELLKVGKAAESAGTAAAGTGRQSAEALTRTAAASEKAATALDNVRGMWMKVGAALGTLAAASQVIQMADAVTTLRNRLELATGSAVKAAQAFDQLFQVAQQSRTSFTELGATYATMARAGQQLGLSQTTLMTVTQAIGNAMAISGGSAAGMQAALVQLGQGMSSGVLRGEELNSVMEQAPRLAQALADGLGVPIGELRKLGEEGSLTSQRVIEALSKSAPKLAEEVKNATMTVGQAFTVLGNSTTFFIGEADKATGASKLLAAAVVGLAGALEATAKVIKENETLFSIIGATLGAGAVIGVVALGKAVLTSLLPALVTFGAAAVVALGPVGLAVAGITIAVTGAIAALNAFKGSETGLKNRIAQLEGPQSIYGPRGAEKEEELKRLRAQLAEKQYAPVATDGMRAVEAEMLKASQAQEAAELKKLTEIKAKLSGVDKEHITTVQQLAAMVAAGNLSTAEYVQLTRALTAETKAGKDATKDAEQAAKDRAEKEKAVYESLMKGAMARSDMRVKESKSIADFESSEDARRHKEIKSAEGALQAAEDEFANYGKLKSEIAQTTLLRMKDKLARYTEGSDNANSVLAEIEAQKKLIDVLRKGEVRDASAGAAKKAADEWKRASDDIERSLTDALMRGFEGGRGFIDSFKSVLVNAFKTMVLKPVIEAQVRGGANVLGNFIGNGLGGQGGGQGGGLLSGFASAYGGAGGGLQGAWAGLSGMFGGGGAGGAGGAVNSYLTTGGVEGSIVGGGTGGGAGAVGGAASLASLYVAGAVITAKMAMKDQAAGFNQRAAREAGNGFGGRYGVGTVFAETSNLLKKFGINDKWADILSMSTGFAKVFGRSTAQATGTGIAGTIGGGAMDVRAFQDWRAKGGLFRGDKTGTNFSSLDGRQKESLNSSAAGVYDTVSDWAKALALPLQGLRGITTQVRVTLTGDAAEDQAAVDAILNTYKDTLANSFSAALQPFVKGAETFTETLQRLAGLQVFSDSLNSLGGIFSRVALLGVDARESFIAMAGGMEALQSKALGFIQNYYSREEIAGLKAREIQGVLQGAGISGDVNTREQFRAIVEGLDVGSEAGRKQLATLLGISGSFTGVADYLAETGSTLSQAAGAAPAMGSLGPLLSTGTAQVVATNEVRDAIGELHRDLVDVLRGSEGMPYRGGDRGRTPRVVEIGEAP